MSRILTIFFVHGRVSGSWTSTATGNIHIIKFSRILRLLVDSLSTQNIWSGNQDSDWLQRTSEKNSVFRSTFLFSFFSKASSSNEIVSSCSLLTVLLLYLMMSQSSSAATLNLLVLVSSLLVRLKPSYLLVYLRCSPLLSPRSSTSWWNFSNVSFLLQYEEASSSSTAIFEVVSEN